MDSKQLSEQLIKDIELLKSHGETAIDCDRLISNLKNIDHSAGEISDRDMEHYKITANLTLESFKSAIVYGQGAVKSLFILNGGAVVILLTFVTNLKQNDVGYFVPCLYPFASGVLFAAMLAFLAYVTQLLYSYQEDTIRKFGAFFHVVSVIVAAIALYLFFEGFTLTSAALETYGKKL